MKSFKTTIYLPDLFENEISNPMEIAKIGIVAGSTLYVTRVQLDNGELGIVFLDDDKQCEKVEE